MKILQGDCLEVLKGLESESVDALVTDPPAGISFMSKAWDSDRGGRAMWVLWITEVFAQCLRVLKPGAHGLVWALPRTSHWTATALEDAGFEIRDCVYHLFGSGFPKSLDVSKAIDKAAGAEREVTGKIIYRENNSIHRGEFGNLAPTEDGKMKRQWDVTAPATDAAKQWAGFGTALKPAVECWWLVRKPLSEKTVAANVLKWGTGALNIDGSSIVASDQARLAKNWDREKISDMSGGRYGAGSGKINSGMDNKWSAPLGRFPANLVLSHSEYCTDDQCDIECAIQMLDEQSGYLHGAGNKSDTGEGVLEVKNAANYGFAYAGRANRIHDRGGHASRFFYCAKVSASERNAGLESMPDRLKLTQMRSANGTGKKNFEGGFNDTIAKNHHPTVKPQKLMRYLARLITPPGGVVLDPFMGSGSTGCACALEGFEFIGIEQEQEYIHIAKKRIEHWGKAERS